MSEFKSEKLTTRFMEGATKTEPLIPRRYTLTHSDETGELYLTIGLDFTYERINPVRDEVFGEWLWFMEGVRYYVYLQGSSAGPVNKEREAIRYAIFQQELPLALQAIRYGDREFFDANPAFDYYPILVFFQYSDMAQNRAEDWGTFTDYVDRS